MVASQITSLTPWYCLLNRLFRCRSQKISKLRVTGLCAEFTGDRWIPRTARARARAIHRQTGIMKAEFNHSKMILQFINQRAMHFKKNTNVDKTWLVIILSPGRVGKSKKSFWLYHWFCRRKILWYYVIRFLCTFLLYTELYLIS